LSGGLAYWLARKALSPIDRLRQATDAITADQLDQRLPLQNPHDELGLLTGTINAMIARLERSFAEIRRFTADASHELRTPLTALRMEVEVALGRTQTVDEAVQALGNILEELVRMSHLTDQLLTLSRRDAGVEQLARTPQDLHALVAGVVDSMQALAESKEIQLQIEGRGPLWVKGNESSLRQVFINTLDNALKFTPEKGKVIVRIIRLNGTVRVTVADTGIGIAPEHLPRVFDRFYRVDTSRSRAVGGTGLGLSIAQGIVHAHEGRIELSSHSGQGTTCTVSLPLMATTPTDPPSTDPTAAELGRQSNPEGNLA
jgi:two-component system, OmpR family, heavy metal sensor histidine kinase CusS